jgi:hypothetical protein
MVMVAPPLVNGEHFGGIDEHRERGTSAVRSPVRCTRAPPSPTTRARRGREGCQSTAPTELVGRSPLERKSSARGGRLRGRGGLARRLERAQMESHLGGVPPGGCSLLRGTTCSSRPARWPATIPAGSDLGGRPGPPPAELARHADRRPLVDESMPALGAGLEPQPHSGRTGRARRWAWSCFTAASGQTARLSPGKSHGAAHVGPPLELPHQAIEDDLRWSSAHPGEISVWPVSGSVLPRRWDLVARQLERLAAGRPGGGALG